MAPLNNLTEHQTIILRWLVEQHEAGFIEDEFVIVWTYGGPEILDFQGDMSSAPKITQGALDALAANGYILSYPSLTSRNTRRCVFTGKAFTAFLNTAANKPESNLSYRGHEITVETLESTGTARKWLFKVTSQGTFKFSLLLKISDLFLSGSEFLVAAAGGPDAFAMREGLKHVHGHIDLAKYFLGEEIVVEIKTYTQQEIEAKAKFISDGDIRQALLEVLWRVRQESPKQAIDVQGIATVMGVAVERVETAITGLEVDQLIELDRLDKNAIKNGRFFITNKGIKQVTEAVDDATHTISDAAIKTRQLLTKYFSLDELKTLCDDCGIRHETLKHSTIPELSRELVAAAERTDRFAKLLGLCREQRPHVDWPVA